MLEVLSLAFYNFQGGPLGEVINSLEQIGFFSLILPFLLLFAVVFAILSKIKVFEEKKGVNGIIAFVVALMALQLDFVSRFFTEIFPRVGVGIAIILIIIIFLGMFLPDEGWAKYTLLGIVGVVLVVILIQTAGALGWSAGSWWYDNWPLVAGIITVVVIIAVIVGASSEKKTNPAVPFFQSLFEKK